MPAQISAKAKDGTSRGWLWRSVQRAVFQPRPRFRRRRRPYPERRCSSPPKVRRPEPFVLPRWLRWLALRHVNQSQLHVREEVLGIDLQSWRACSIASGTAGPGIDPGSNLIHIADSGSIVPPCGLRNPLLGRSQTGEIPAVRFVCEARFWIQLDRSQILFPAAGQSKSYQNSHLPEPCAPPPVRRPIRTAFNAAAFIFGMASLAGTKNSETIP